MTDAAMAYIWAAAQQITQSEGGRIVSVDAGSPPTTERWRPRARRRTTIDRCGWCKSPSTRRRRMPVRQRRAACRAVRDVRPRCAHPRGPGRRDGIVAGTSAGSAAARAHRPRPRRALIWNTHPTMSKPAPLTLSGDPCRGARVGLPRGLGVEPASFNRPTRRTATCPADAHRGVAPESSHRLRAGERTGPQHLRRGDRLESRLPAGRPRIRPPHNRSGLPSSRQNAHPRPAQHRDPSRTTGQPMQIWSSDTPRGGQAILVVDERYPHASRWRLTLSAAPDGNEVGC